MNILFMTSAAPEKAGFSTSEKRPPLGVGFLMAILKKEGHKIFFSDEYLSPTNILDTDFLVKQAIDFVCIYSNTICYQSTLKMFEKIQSQREQKKWNGKIAVGGPHTSIGYSEIPEYVDYIVIGEGEISLPKIINGEITARIVYGEKVENLDLLPMPAWEEFIYRNYCWSDQWLDAYPVYTMNTSRGCPFECTFCSVKSIWGQTYRSMSPERVVDDILFMKKFYGAKGIFFREDHFTLNKNRTVDFCELMIKKNVNIDWICETRADQLNDYAYQKLMADAGCKAFYIGVESGSPQMLKMFKKGETVEQFIEAFDVSKKVGIKTYASFVVGVPYETDEDRLLTDKFIERIKPDFIGKNVFVGIPGSSLVDQIKKDNLYEYEDENHILYPVNFLRNVYKYYGDNDYFKVYEKHKNEVKKIIFDSEIVFTNDLSLSRLSAAKIDENIIEMEFQFIVNGKIPKDYTIYFHGSVEDSDVRYLPDDRKIYGFENWDFRPKQPMSEWKYGAFSVSKNIFITVSSYFLRMGLFDSEKNETVGDSAILGFVDLSNI